MCRCVVSEQERDVDPFAQCVHAAPAAVDEFMRVGIADLAKEKARGDEEADFRGDAVGLVCECVDHEGQNEEMGDAKRDREPFGGRELAVGRGRCDDVNDLVEDRRQNSEEGEGRNDPPAAPNRCRTDKRNRGQGRGGKKPNWGEPLEHLRDLARGLRHVRGKDCTKLFTITRRKG